MITTEAASRLESGGSIVAGTVDADGLPDAMRAWLIRVAPGGTHLRCLLPAQEERSLANLRAGGPIALNWTHVHTMDSIQVKGRATAVDEPTDEDLALKDAFVEDFFALLQESDGTPRELLDRLVPATFAAVEVDVDGVWDQTPGPNAGVAV